MIETTEREKGKLDQALGEYQAAMQDLQRAQMRRQLAMQGLEALIGSIAAEHGHTEEVRRWNVTPTFDLEPMEPETNGHK